MPSTQSVISSTNTPLPAEGIFISKVEKILNYTGADITLVSDTECQIIIWGGPTIDGPWESIFQSPTTSPNVSYSATYLTFYPYSYLYVRNLTDAPQTFLHVSHILRVHSHIVESISSQSVITANVNLNQVGGDPIALGSATSVNSLPVVIASDQTVPVTFSGTVETNLSQVGGDAIALGSATSVNSLPVVIASDQTVPVTFSGTVETNLSQVGGTTINLGSAISNLSIPVVIASDQSLTVGVSGTVETDLIRVGGTDIFLGSAISSLSIPVVIASDQTVPISLSGTVDTNLYRVGGTMINLGSAISNLSIPVVIASDQTLTVSGTVNIEGGNTNSVAIDGNVGISANLLGNKTPLTATQVVDGNVVLNVFQNGWSSSSNIWYNGTFVASSGGGLTKQYQLSQIQVGSIGYKQVSIYGTVSALDGTTPLNLTIVYSRNNSDWYDSSLGVINFTTIGDFSRDWTTSADYVSIYADTPATVKLFYSTSM